MTIRITITKPQVTDQYGIAMNVGQIYAVDKNFGQSLVQQGRAIDTDNALTSPNGDALIDIIWLSPAEIANPTTQQLNRPNIIYKSNVAPYYEYKSNGTYLIPLNNNKITRPVRIISSFGGWSTQSQVQSNGTTQLSATDRLRVIPWADANDIQVIMVNGYSSTNGKVNLNGNAVLIAVSIENGASPYPQFSFRNNNGVKANTDPGGGRTAHYIGDGEIAISEPLGFPLLTANTNYIHCYHKVGSSEKFPTSAQNLTGSAFDGQTTDFVWGTTVHNGQDNTASYQSMGNYALNDYAFAPQVVLGKFLNPIPVVLIAGDSLADGTAGGTGAYLFKQYVHVALDAANIKYHKDAVSGCTMQNYAGNQIYIGLLGQYVDMVAWVMGTNDIAVGTSLANIQLYLYQCLSRFSGNPRIALHTLPPRPASSSDSWTTISGQTLGSWESVRVAYNNWLRSSAISWGAALGLNIVTVNDVVLGVEYNLNGTVMTLDITGQQATSGLNIGGYWKPSTTGDGVHPNNSGIDIMKFNVNVSSSYAGAGYLPYY